MKLTKQKYLAFTRDLAFTSVALFTVNCVPAPDTADEDEETTTTTTVTSNDTISTGTTTVATTVSSVGSLAVAFPSNLSIGTTLTRSSSSAGLALADSEETLETITEPLSIEEKNEVIDDILDSPAIAQCFKLVVGSFPQPGCFAPNATAEDVTAAASSDNPFVFTPQDGFQRILYGDAGMVKANEGTQACSTATISYFTEDALQYIEQAKQIFASLVCASKFTDTSLPDIGSETNYLPILSGVELPDQAVFNKATISREASAAGDIYTTELAITFPGEYGNRKTYALFRNQPSSTVTGTSKGHVVVIQSNVPDKLSTANGEQFQNPPKGAAAVSVRYQITGERKEVYLDRFDVKSEAMANIHPADYIEADGSINFVGISEQVAGGDNNAAQNFFQTKFILDPTVALMNEGIVGWTASLGDGYWRSFAFNVNRNADGSETAKATFGFASANTGGGGHSQALSNFDDATAPNQMFCAWAQDSGDAPQPDGDANNDDNQQQANLFLTENNNDGDDNQNNLGPAPGEGDEPPEGGGIGGQAQSLIQYQVANKANINSDFVHNEAESSISYHIAQDCGDTGADLEASESDGSITDKFDAPEFSDFTALGGVSLNSNAMPLE